MCNNTIFTVFNKNNPKVFKEGKKITFLLWDLARWRQSWTYFFATVMDLACTPHSATQCELGQSWENIWLISTAAFSEELMRERYPCQWATSHHLSIAVSWGMRQLYSFLFLVEKVYVLGRSHWSCYQMLCYPQLLKMQLLIRTIYLWFYLEIRDYFATLCSHSLSIFHRMSWRTWQCHQI